MTNSDIQSSLLREPIKSLLHIFNFPNDIEQLTSYLSAEVLSAKLSIGEGYDLVCQDDVEGDLYYEQYIFEKKRIPTRPDNWHDFFNAIIWSLFPKTKAFLNEMHIAEIKQFGLNPRSKIRNQITLFDECGVIVLTTTKQLLPALQSHSWQDVFKGEEVKWLINTQALIFGHANYEMLLKPFIGLTAKALVIEVDNLLDLSDRGTYSALDEILLTYCQKNKVFEQKKPFRPLPLLGVPGWHFSAQNDQFYRDTSYFMPKRRAR